jgi:hypothetical protein
VNPAVREFLERFSGEDESAAAPAEFPRWRAVVDGGERRWSDVAT